VRKLWVAHPALTEKVLYDGVREYTNEILSWSACIQLIKSLNDKPSLDDIENQIFLSYEHWFKNESYNKEYPLFNDFIKFFIENPSEGDFSPFPNWEEH